jgi:hypothetical protein
MTKSTTNRPRGQLPGLPSWVKPQLCKLLDAPLQGPEWLHEIKYDGYRMHARLDRGGAHLLTRTGLDGTHKYPPIAAAVTVLPAKQAYLDGDLYGIRSDGKTSFSMIQNGFGRWIEYAGGYADMLAQRAEAPRGSPATKARRVKQAQPATQSGALPSGLPRRMNFNDRRALAD